MDKDIDLKYTKNRDIWHRFNQILPSNTQTLRNFCKEHLGSFGESSTIRQPFRCDVGESVHIGENCYINCDVTILGHGTVTLEDNVGISSGVTIVAIKHPENPLCGEWIDIPQSVTIKKGAIIGCNSTILGDITIGENAVIGAGSVVTHDVPANTTVAGNPARQLKP